MIEETGDIWDSKFDGCWRVIPINCQINSRRELIMGKGLAKDAKERYPGLSCELGIFYEKAGNIRTVYISESIRLIALPTKIHWRDGSSLDLIEVGLLELRNIKRHDVIRGRIVLPHLGCGEGGLDWPLQVRPLMLKYLEDSDEFVVVGPFC